MMKIQATDYALSIHCEFTEIISEMVGGADPTEGARITVLNFRSPDYDATKGGYHPVEVALNSEGRILYITEFSYVGIGEMAELAKELDFDFQAGLFQQLGRDYPIEQAWELFEVWQENFCHYYRCGVYQIDVTHQ